MIKPLSSSITRTGKCCTKETLFSKKLSKNIQKLRFLLKTREHSTLQNKTRNRLSKQKIISREGNNRSITKKAEEV